MSSIDEGTNYCIGPLIRYFMNYHFNKPQNNENESSEEGIDISLEKKEMINNEKRERKKAMIIDNLCGDCCICITKLHTRDIYESKLYNVIINAKYIKNMKKHYGLRILNCGHVYHTKCINRWRMRSSECPCCKQTF
jgi:hypothetical protein